MKVSLTVFLVPLLAIVSTMANQMDVQSANNEFAIDLFRSLSKKESGNIFFSPLSIHAALSMLYLGAEGPTKEAFTNALHVSDPSSVAEGYQEVMDQLNNAEDVNLTIANKIYVKNDFTLKPGFENTVDTKFQSEIESLDFTNAADAAKVVNSWVNEKTHEKIPKLFEESDLKSDPRLLLVNAVYFKGTWGHKFDEALTEKQQFYVDSDKNFEVDMMRQVHDFPYKDCEHLDAQVLELPYTNQDLSLVVILPHSKDGIEDLKEKLVNGDLSKVTENLNSMHMAVTLPKFKLETSMDLKDALIDIGLGELYESPDLSGLLENPGPLVVSKAIQKAYIEVSEEGTEAAASTGIIVAPGAALPRSFTADHPFFIILQKKSSSGSYPLFFGLVKDPSH